MSSKVTVDFFRVRIDAENIKFEELLAHIAALSELKRNLQYHGDVLRLHSLHQTNQSREGDMTRIRLDDLPSKASLEGDLSAIDLGENEGLGEQVAFIYHPTTEILLLQRNRNSLTARNFAYYVSEKGGADEPIYFDPVLREDAVRRLAEMQVIRKFDVRFAKVNNTAVLRNNNRSTKEMIDILDYFSAPSARLLLSMGHKKGSLPLEKIKSAARALAGIGQQNHQHNEVVRVEIAGTDAEGEPDVLDLVEFKMVEVVSAEAEGRRLPYQSRRAALRKAFENRRAELGRMFKNRDSQ
jgi:hypothetical protein